MVYNFSGYRYRQKELTAEDFFRVKELISEVINIDNINEKSIAKIIDELKDTGKLEEIFRIILIPEPKFIDRLFKKYDKRFLEIMTLQDIATVITDFFVLNFSWLGNLQDIVRGLG